MIVDIVAGTVVVAGAALMALGSYGLLRFPDVFTRMHAATKAAAVGVIGTTMAATLQAGGLSGTFILLIVVALLFLSGPLGMSLLARAAYHDVDTQRFRNTRELSVALPREETTATTRGSGTSPFLAIWLLLVWLAAFGSLAPNVVIGGIVVASGLAWALRSIAPRWPGALVHPIGALRFIVHFTGRMIVSTWEVIVSLWVPTDELKPAILEIPLRVHTRNELTLLMNCISFTPGTVALELHGNRLYVHVLSTDDPSEVIAEIKEMESRIMAAFSNAGRDVGPLSSPDLGSGPPP